MKIRSLLKTAVALLTTCAFGFAQAQNTPIKFQLDWRFIGPAALFITPHAKGYFKDAKLDVSIDAGSGSAGAIIRIASGNYDIGFADMASLMEFHANNPDAPNKPVAVMMVYNSTPASVMALKKSGIKTPADLAGKKLGAPIFDAGRKAFPIFQKANNVGNVAWTTMEPGLRETMLLRGDVDAITSFTFTSLLDMVARGVNENEFVVMQYPDFGVNLYGNAIIASPKIIKENPAAVKAFLSAFTKGAKDVINNPAAAIADVKARNEIINVELETRRLQMAIDTVINNASGREEGFGRISGPRLSLMASQVSDAFNTKTRVKVDDIWNGSFLPTAKELDILPKTIK